MRVRPAMSFADSMRHTASMARWTSVVTRSALGELRFLERRERIRHSLNEAFVADARRPRRKIARRTVPAERLDVAEERCIGSERREVLEQKGQLALVVA